MAAAGSAGAGSERTFGGVGVCATGTGGDVGLQWAALAAAGTIAGSDGARRRSRMRGSLAWIAWRGAAAGAPISSRAST